MKQHIAVVGLGYIGLPTALLLAKAGATVTGCDIDAKKIAGLATGILPFQEPGLTELYASAKENFSASTKVPVADVYIVCVPTPVTADKKCDNRFVESATNSIAPVLQAGATVIIESTVAPGTTTGIVRSILEKGGLVAGKDFYLGFVSEKAIPGNTISEMIKNDRIAGGLTPECKKRVAAVYGLFVEGAFFQTDCTTAEVVKLVENSYRDVNIAFANELARTCTTLGINVWEVISLANHHPRVNVHEPGPGVGGHCIALDPWFLQSSDPANTTIIKRAREINDGMPSYVATVVDKIAKNHQSKCIGILGVAYKKNVDDGRETPAEPIFKELVARGFTVLVHDPLVTKTNVPLTTLEELLASADGVIIVTDHDAYKTIALTPKQKWLIDTRGLLLTNPPKNISYYALGTSAFNL